MIYVPVLHVTIKSEFQKDNGRSNKRIGAVAVDDTKLIVYIMDEPTEYHGYIIRVENQSPPIGQSRKVAAERSFYTYIII